MCMVQKIYDLVFTRYFMNILKHQRKEKKHIFYFFCLDLVSSLHLSTFHGDIGSYSRSMCLLVVCGCATHVVFTHGGELLPSSLSLVSTDILR